MKWRTPVWAGAAAFGLCVLQAPDEAAGQALAWRQLHAADFPARVQAVVFANGAWNAGDAWTWGQWKAQLSAEPVADAFLCDSTVCPSFRIEHIVCTNQVLGESPCTLTISWRIAFYDTACALYIEKSKRDVPVTCPLSVRFK
jgi:hypothetical protein